MGWNPNAEGQGLAASVKFFKVRILAAILVCSASGVRVVDPSWKLPTARFAIIADRYCSGYHRPSPRVSSLGGVQAGKAR